MLEGMCSSYLFRFRRIPTFGKDTIRKFANNVSETKQLAARDYEDILQVHVVFVVVPMILILMSYTSARYLPWKVCLKSLITLTSWTSCIRSPIGTALPSFECILMIPSEFWTPGRTHLAPMFVNLSPRPVGLLELSNSTRSMPLANEERQRKSWRGHPKRTHQPQIRRPHPKMEDP